MDDFQSSLESFISQKLKALEQSYTCSSRQDLMTPLATDTSTNGETPTVSKNQCDILFKPSLSSNGKEIESPIKDSGFLNENSPFFPSRPATPKYTQSLSNSLSNGKSNLPAHVNQPLCHSKVALVQKREKKTKRKIAQVSSQKKKRTRTCAAMAQPSNHFSPLVHLMSPSAGRITSCMRSVRNGTLSPGCLASPMNALDDSFYSTGKESVPQVTTENYQILSSNAHKTRVSTIQHYEHLCYMYVHV